MDALSSAVREVIGKARCEDGCVSFEPAVPADGSATLLIWEHWASKSAFDAHNAHPYMQELYGKLGDWLAAAPDIVEIKELEG